MQWKSTSLATRSKLHMINGPDKHVEKQRIYRYWSRCVEGKERCENREENHQSEGEEKNSKTFSRTARTGNEVLSRMCTSVGVVDKSVNISLQLTIFPFPSKATRQNMDTAQEHQPLSMRSK